MFQQISFFKAENVRFDKITDGTARRKFPHWSNNKETWGANVYSNFHSDDVAQFQWIMYTWTCHVYNMTTRIMRCSDNTVRQKNQYSEDLPNSIKSCSWVILGAARGTERIVSHEYCSHSTAQTAFTQPTFFINQKYATAIIRTVYIHQGFYYAFKAQGPLICKGYHL